ncbi:MAG: hypothetical protein QOD06_211 [Candidatus Binatota bacterium]|nr:hypothetical protein [Candidatus Binatota bacterium]
MAKKPPRPKPVPRAKAPPVEERGLLAALKRAPEKPRPLDDAEAVPLRKPPDETLPPPPVSAPPAAVTPPPLAAALAPAPLSGPGGSGNGWGGGERGPGGGGSGRGGFSVSGAGAGGAGRSYGSIWHDTQRYLAGLRWAYNNELRSNPTLKGVIVVRYEILSSGEVGNVTVVSSTFGDSRLQQQVLSQMRDWRYPAEPSGDVIVTWPFSFLPPS